jgi:hypothetical protein
MKSKKLNKQRGNKLFLGHAKADKPMAEEIAKLVGRVTLQGINVWYSSDD